ncbi:MAG: hypothetical protein QOE92_933 [Chloroflexota bacterium]|nr:hypothetical protein [Chloroflexota bacterium]
MSLPDRATEAQTLRDCLAQAIRADELGYHCVWVVEHHGLFEYAHMSSPEVFLGAVAVSTSRVRIGHAVSLTPYRYNHPIRVAERVATLDVLSGGRMSWGSGKSSSRVEQDAFEIDRAELDEQWLEALEMIPRMWRSDVFEWDGRFFHIPPIQVIPKPLQQPHPPIFAACSRPETLVTAGRLGVGSLNFTAGTDEVMTQKVQSYRDAIKSADVRTRRLNDHFACTPTCLVLDDDHKAAEYGFRGTRFFAEGLATYFTSERRPIGPLDIARDHLTPGDLEAAMAERGRPGSALTSIIGDPGAAREAVKRFVATGADELILVMQLGTVPHELVMESMQTFAEKVMPEFAS